MTKIKISKSIYEKIISMKKTEKDKKIYRRLQFLHLKYKGKTNKEIADTVGVCQNTITSWTLIYSEKGLKGLCVPINFDRRISKIDSHIIDIKKDIKDNVISTLAELQNWIKKKYSLKMEQSWLFRCCKKNSIYLIKKHA